MDIDKAKGIICSAFGEKERIDERGKRKRGEGVLPDDSALLPASWLIELY
jgi:hypothetical protein